jgi:hypothetical protein
MEFDYSDFLCPQYGSVRVSIVSEKCGFVALRTKSKTRVLSSNVQTRCIENFQNIHSCRRNMDWGAS